MGVCPSIVLNSDASENVAYNNPDFPAYIKKGQLSRYPDFRAVSHWHDDLEFILILDGQMFYDVNGQKISLQAGEWNFCKQPLLSLWLFRCSYRMSLYLYFCYSPQLLSVNTYFVEKCLNPLIQNIHFPYQPLIRLSCGRILSS